MVDFLPSTVDSVADEDRDPRVVGVDSDDADALVAALSSQTGRDILAALYEEPATPATIAERVDTSLQNAQYHLGKLEDGNLVEVADTAYSEKGREMKVYAPTAEPLVLFAGNESDTGGLQSALKNLLGGIGVLGLASLVVQRLADRQATRRTLVRKRVERRLEERQQCGDHGGPRRWFRRWERAEYDPYEFDAREHDSPPRGRSGRQRDVEHRPEHDGRPHDDRQFITRVRRRHTG